MIGGQFNLNAELVAVYNLELFCYFRVYEYFAEVYYLLLHGHVFEGLNGELFVDLLLLLFVLWLFADLGCQLLCL